MKILQFACCVLFGILTKALAQDSDSNLLYKIASEAPGQEHTLKELAIALDELLGLERHNNNQLNDKTNFRRLNGDSTITSVVTRIVQILSNFKNRIDNKANTEAIASLQTAVDLKADASALASKADVSALASKANASDLALKADASALNDLSNTVSLIDTSIFAEKTDLEILNTTVQMLNNAIHDPTALQDLLALEQSLNSIFPSPYIGWDAATSCGNSLDGNFTEVINDLNQLIGFDSSGTNSCNDFKCDLTLNRVQEMCMHNMKQCISECVQVPGTTQCYHPTAGSDADHLKCLRCTYNTDNSACEDTALILNDGLDDHAACFNVDNACQMMMSSEYE